MSLPHLSLCYKRVSCHLQEKQTKGCFFFNDKGHSRLADFENRKMRKNTKINNSNFFFPLFLYDSPKFSNSSQQLISHTNIPLFHTYFPKSKSAVAMKSFQILVNILESNNISLKTQLAASFFTLCLQKLKKISSTNDIQYSQPQDKLLQNNLGQAEAYIVTSRNGGKEASRGDVRIPARHDCPCSSFCLQI